VPGGFKPPDELLRGLGYDVTETDEAERILPTAITEKSARAQMVDWSR